MARNRVITITKKLLDFYRSGELNEYSNLEKSIQRSIINFGEDYDLEVDKKTYQEYLSFSDSIIEKS